MKLNKHQIDAYLRRVSNILLFNGGFLSDLGLYTGEMGLALFFSVYSRYTKNELYSDYSLHLIDYIQNNLHRETPIDYRQGLTGIGSAFEYLVQSGYFDADTDDLLEEFDERIFSFDKLPFLSFDELSGIAFYAYWRLSGKSAKKDTISKTVLPQVVLLMASKSKNAEAEHPLVSFFSSIISADSTAVFSGARHRLYRKNHPFRLESEEPYSRLLEPFSKSDVLIRNTFNLWVENGLAGLGLCLIAELDGDDSWTALFST